MKRFSLTYALFLMGFTAILAQVVLIRELLTSFSGNELAIGIFFANWLLLEALGSYVAGRLAGKVRSGTLYYVGLQLILTFVVPAVIVLTRIIKPLLGIIPGQGINVLTMFYASFLLLTPLGLIDGAQFSFGCRIFTEGKPKEASSIGRVYIYEAFGSLLGGIIGTYLCLQYLHAFQTAFILTLLNLTSALFLLAANARPHRKLKMITGLLLGLWMIVFLTGWIERLQTNSISTQWRDYKVLDSRNSIYGNVTVLERFEQLNIMSNGVPIATLPDPDTVFIEEFVHLPLLFHHDPQQVLIVGGGIGGVIREILKHPVQHVDYAELDPLIIHTARQYAPSQTDLDLNDARVHVHYVDGRYFIRTTDRYYDLIFINLPDPSTLEINRFYTQEFYQMSKQRLNKDGLLCFLLPGSTVYLSKELIDLNAVLIQTAEQIFPYVRVIPGDMNLVLASADNDVITKTPEILTQRMIDRSLQLQALSDFHILYKFDNLRLDWYHKQIAKAGQMAPNQDFSPSALYHDLAFWNSVHSPEFAKIFTWLKQLRIGYMVAALTIMLVGFLVVQSFRATRKPVFVVLPIMATGFTGMGVDIVLVLTFQTVYGYIYHWIGLLITAFMIGLTCGGTWILRRKTQNMQRLFLTLEALIVLYTALLIGILVLVNTWQETPLIFSSARFILLLLNALCGFLVGAEFPLANRIYLSNAGQYTQTAGTLYAADLIGSWFGALLVAVILVPLFGILNTCALLMFVNTCSALVFYFGRHLVA